MSLTSYRPVRGIRAGLPLAVTLLWAGGCGVLGAAPNNIDARTPSDTPLKEVPGPTTDLGVLESGLKERRELYPGIDPIFPELRDDIAFPTSPFFDDAVLSLEPRFFSFYRDNRDGSISQTTALGGTLGLESGWWRDALQLGVTAFGSQKLYGPSDRDGIGLLRPGQSSYIVLGEAYANFRFRKSSASLGWKELTLPYLNGHDIRMTPNSFEYVGLKSTEMAGFQFAAGHVNRIRPRTDGSFKYMSEQAGAEGSKKGVSVIGARWDITDDFHVAAVDLYGWDTFNTFYAELEWLRELESGSTLRFGLQFTDQRHVGDALVGNSESQIGGVKAAWAQGPLTLSGAFTWASDDDAILKPWGGSPSYNSIMIGDFDRAGERAVQVGATFDFSSLCLEGLSANTRYAYGTVSGSEPDQKEFNFTVDYRVPGDFLEDLWIRARYARNSLGSSGSITDYRLEMNYAVEF